MLKSLFDAIGDKFTMISFGEPDCPVKCLAAIPREISDQENGWLPQWQVLRLGRRAK